MRFYQISVSISVSMISNLRDKISPPREKKKKKEKKGGKDQISITISNYRYDMISNCSTYSTYICTVHKYM